MPINSSGSVERFALAAGETKSFEVLHPGGTIWDFDATAEIFQDQNGAMSGTTASVALYSSEDGSSWGSAVVTAAPVPGATKPATGAVGRFSKFQNNAANGLVWVVARSTNRVQPQVSL